jgi:hypothetical protein
MRRKTSSSCSRESASNASFNLPSNFPDSSLSRKSLASQSMWKSDLFGPERCHPMEIKGTDGNNLLLRQVQKLVSSLLFSGGR